MDKLAQIEGRLRVSQERERSNRELMTRMGENLEALRALTARIDERIEQGEADSSTTVSQSQLIRWLALAVVLASLGSKALELLAGLLPAAAGH